MSLYILQLAMRVSFSWKYDYDLEIAIYYNDNGN